MGRPPVLRPQLRRDSLGGGEVKPSQGFLLFLTLRFGLLAAAVQSCLSQIVNQAVLTYRFDAWYGQSSLIATMLVIGVALYGLRMSMEHSPLPTSRYPARDAARI